MWERLKAWAKSVKINLGALYLATRDARTSSIAKIIAICVVAYALSPIDLIPDFIPVLGLLDDVILVPAGIWAAVKLIPKPLMDEFRLAAQSEKRLPPNWFGLALIVTLWAVVAWLIWQSL